jgi:hypothetical protein
MVKESALAGDMDPDAAEMVDAALVEELRWLDQMIGACGGEEG